MPKKKPDELITQKEAAELRGVSISAIGDYIKRGRLKTVEQFGKTLVYKSEVVNLERGKSGPKPKA